MEVREPSASYLGRAAFKQTLAGSIPSDWEVVQTREACTKIQDGTHFSPKLGGSDYLYVTSKNVRFGYLDLKDVDHIDANQHREIYRRCDVKKGDLLLTKDGANTGNAALNPLSEEFSLLSSVAFLRFIPGRYEAAYFLQQILSSNTQKQILDAMSGNAITRLTLDKIRNLAIPTPPTLAEQGAIATALGDADALIESLEQLLAKKRQIKQGAMQELLTAQRRLPGFKGEWIVRTVEDIAEVKTGPFGSTLHERDYVQSGTPIIAVEHIGEFGITLQNLPLVSDEDARRLRAYSLEAGDIVFSRVGAVDRNALVRESEKGWLFSGRLLRVRPNKNAVNPAFLSFQFHSEAFRNSVLAVAVGQTMASLNTRILSELLVRLPTLEEQTAIAQVLSDMDADIAAVEAKLAKARAIKQGMMQELLTGRIRLV